MSDCSCGDLKARVPFVSCPVHGKMYWDEGTEEPSEWINLSTHGEASRSKDRDEFLALVNSIGPLIVLYENDLLEPEERSFLEAVATSVWPEMIEIIAAVWTTLGPILERHGLWREKR